MENAQIYTKGDLAFNAICQKENIGISEAEYLVGLANYATSAALFLCFRHSNFSSVNAPAFTASIMP